ncbi:hypothetical protein EVAR_84592_1 [Eumeta japonica]|uniref:Uncharacterized protein n=1 Tax=Eumeta variegata TaxID=151549 RepID=A0A4C1ZB39_EUMVA|nr:hypothetical protein EVAR_84592_1 [Eumeta japonica]
MGLLVMFSRDRRAFIVADRAKMLPLALRAGWCQRGLVDGRREAAQRRTPVGRGRTALSGLAGRAPRTAH